MTISPMVFGRDAEGDEACEWPPRFVTWSGPTPDPYRTQWHSLCPLPPERCEWNDGEEDACQLPQDYEAGHHTMCSFHGEVWLHRAAREYGEDLSESWSNARRADEPTPPLREPHPALPDANPKASPARSRTEGEGLAAPPDDSVGRADGSGLPDAERQGASSADAALHREEEAGE